MAEVRSMTDNLRERCIAILDEADAEITRLQEALAAAESEHRKQTSDMAERFRAVNISRVIEQTGQNIFDLRDRAEAAEAKLASLPALLAETRKRALEEAAQVAENTVDFNDDGLSTFDAAQIITAAIRALSQEQSK